MTRLGLLVAVLCCSLPAAAQPARFALLVGNNRGHADDTPLRFAQADATRLASLLVDLGGFPEENTTVLKERDAAAVRRALLNINERVRQSVAGGRQAILFVYYSGHADAHSLHLSGSSFAVEELRKMVSGSAATARVLMLDACRSGATTRIKGGRPAPPFAIRIVDRLGSEGLAVITSSAASEDSQESDQLQGSFFTHFLISGLRGVADRNHDGQVSLTEAYAYAYANTLQATSKTLAGPQHPTYEYDIRGKGDFIITRIDRGAGHGRLLFPSSGHYLILRGGPEGPVLAEVLDEAPGARVLLPAGKYFVRKRRPDLLLEGYVQVPSGGEAVVEPRKMRQVAYAQLVRKGAAAAALSHGPQIGYLIHGPVAEGLGPISQIELGYPISLRHLSLAPRLAYGWFSGANRDLSLAHHELSASLGAYHAFDLQRLSPFLGLIVGWTFLAQSFSTAGKAPDRHSNLFHFGAEAGLDIHLPRGFYLQARGAALSFVFRGSGGSVRPAITYQAAAGIGWQLR